MTEEQFNVLEDWVESQSEYAAALVKAEFCEYSYEYEQLAAWDARDKAKKLLVGEDQ